MQFETDRRQFLQEICQRIDRSGFDPGAEGLDEVVNDPTILNSTGQDRRNAMRMIAAGFAYAVAGNLIFSDGAEAQKGTPTPYEIDGRRDRREIATKRLDEDDLPILYEKDLDKDSDFRRERKLVPVRRDADYYFVDGTEVLTSPVDYAFLNPYAYLFLQRFSKDYYSEFRQSNLPRLELNSLTRSDERQVEIGGNAIPPEQSSHCRGCGMDFAYKDMTDDQFDWMRRELIEIQGIRVDGKPIIDAIEERDLSENFHVTVFKNYAQYVMKMEGWSATRYAIELKLKTGGVVF